MTGLGDSERRSSMDAYENAQSYRRDLRPQRAVQWVANSVTLSMQT